MKKPCAKIEEVLPHSIAEKYGIKKGDILESVNGHLLRDIIDYQLFTTEKEVCFKILSQDNKTRELAIKKPVEEDLGIGFANAVFDGIKRCRNKCLFCFVDQMPKGYRETLYIKDDDYRMSFLYGNYVTLTNLRDEDFERIIQDRLSPLYISVHCVDRELRKTLLGVEEKTDLLNNLRRLSQAGIEFNGQIVLVPGYNDGKYLDETIEAMASLGDSMISLALVPVGLTKYQENNLRSFTKEEAANIIDLTEKWQREFMSQRGTNLIYAADEFYLLADKEIPSDWDYEDYPQIENGVGIIRKFYNDFQYSLADLPVPSGIPEKFYIVTGTDGAKALSPLVSVLREKGNNIELLPVINSFFGATVTVTGLLTGKDIIETINQSPDKKGTFLIPDILLKFHTDLLLDDLTINDIVKATERKIKVVETSAYDLLAAINETGEEI